MLLLAQAAAQRGRDWVDYTTLTIAVIGALTGTGALAWQISQSRHAGHRVKVTMTWGIAPVRGQPTTVLIVTAYNEGRGSVQLKTYGVLLPGGRQIFDPYPNEASTPLPHLLEGGHEAQWVMRVADLPDELLATNASRPVELRGYVGLGTGRRMISGGLTCQSGALTNIAAGERPG